MLEGRVAETALFSAVENERTDLVRALLVRGADPNEKENRHGITVLMMAAANGDIKTVKLLLEWGARVNEHDDGDTALIAAVKHRCPLPLIRLLLRHGARVNVKDYLGRTALDWAQENDDGGHWGLERVDKAAIALLKQHGARAHSIRWLQEHD